MSYLKLMKMMYLAEKQFLLTHGERLTGDEMVSMPYGPVLSSAYGCFMGGSEYWDSWIENPGGYDLALRSSVIVNEKDPLDTFDELSLAEQEVLDSIFNEFGNVSRWALVAKLHDPKFCPEWEDPHGSSYPIPVSALLMKNGKTKREADAILRRLEEEEDLLAVNRELS